MRYLFILGLGIVGGIYGVFLVPQSVFAVAVPTGLSPVCGTSEVAFAGLVLNWDDAVVASDSGTATSAGSNTLTDAAKSWSSDEWVDGRVQITDGSGAGQFRTITSNTSNQITVDSNWSPNPDSSSDYAIILWADHYELYYKLNTSVSWNDNYPSISQFSMPGLVPGKDYQWYVVSCGNDDCSDSASSSTCSFTTIAAAPPPPGSPPGGAPPGSPPGDGGGGGVPAILENPISSQSLPQLFESVLNLLFGLSLVILPIIIIYGGILLLTAGGDPQRMSRAKTILLWAVIAFAIILVARGLPPVLRNLL